MKTKSLSIIITGLFTLILFGCPHALDPDGTPYITPNVYDSLVDDGEGEGADPSADEIWSIYSDTYPVDNDPAIILEIWPTSGDSVVAETVHSPTSEGNNAYKVTVGSLGWDGWALKIDSSIDLSAYSNLHISLRSTDIGNIKINIFDSNSDSEVAVDATTYGFSNDSSYHDLLVPLSAIGNLDTTDINYYITLQTDGGSSGQIYYVDNIYFTKD